MNSLSVCFIIRNEEKNLRECLMNIQDIADEIVIVDTGSTDRSQKICRRHPKVKLVEADWTHDFSAARNVSLENASCDWILVLDADERLENPEELKALIDTETADAFHIRVRNYQPEGSLTAFEDSHLMRLFRNKPSYRFVGRIHEQISTAIHAEKGVVELSNTLILHHGYVQDAVQGFASRRTRNMRLLKAQLEEDPNDFYYVFHMGLALKVDDLDESKAYFEKALILGKEEMPHHLKEQTHMRLAQIALEQNDIFETIRQANLSVKINPLNTTSRVMLITAYMQSGAFAQALPHLQVVTAGSLDRVPNAEDFQKLLIFCQQQMIQQSASKA